MIEKFRFLVNKKIPLPRDMEAEEVLFRDSDVI
jgi:hypothetical protein